MRNEPVVTYGALAGAVVALASLFNVVLDLGTVETALVAVIPVIASVIARQKVSPV